LEKHKKLLRNYSQNIDTLEQVAGIQNVIECHGKKSAGSDFYNKHGFQMRFTVQFLH
jgi:NAD-dependent deacetylase sirtuin 1